MAKRKDKKAERIKQIFNKAKTHSRSQWEYINQKGYDFSNDNQITAQERQALEEQGMPTFTINRIVPVVEMLNFYATAQSPRWQAVGAEGSDIDVAALHSDLADYIWAQSDGSCKYANAINDSITKSLGYLLVTVDQDADNGMGEVKIEQPDPFDVYVDPKSRDIMFRDASFIMIRKLLPKQHLMKLYPAHAKKIKNVSDERHSYEYYSEKSTDALQKDFHYKDIGEAESIDPDSGEHDTLVEFHEFYEKVKIPYINVFYRIPPDKKQLEQIKQQVSVKLQELQKELQVQFLEQDMKMKEAVQNGDMLPQRYELEVKKAQEMMANQLQSAEQEYMSQLQSEMSKIENVVVTEKEFKVMMKNKVFANSLLDQVKFYGDRIRVTTIVGDKTLFENVLPDKIKEYPIVPFHYKWTGTPYPISAVSPLIGKQMELNKAHQIMVHNASLGSSLRWMHEEGSIDTDHWEQYSSSPGALLPIRPGATPPTPVQPMPLSNAFFGIVQEGKRDMEYLAGIYGAMQGDVSAQHDTYRGMLAMDEYGTRRIKQWMKNSIETALMQLGEVVMQFAQSVYTAHKVFRIVQPSALQEDRQVEINVPMYNDFGQVIGKFHDYASAKFDIRIIAGSTLPINRWAYLDELKQLMQLGVIDDIALLSETDIRNKEQIAKRKSLYSQLQGQIQGAQQQLKDQAGTIETLERQLVQAGIKNKVMQASVEINKKKEEVKGGLESRLMEGKNQVDQLTNKMESNVQQQDIKAKGAIDKMSARLATAEKESLTQE